MRIPWAGDAQRARRLDRLLRPFADVRSGESTTVLLLLANAFTILVGYYVLKTSSLHTRPGSPRSRRGLAFQEAGGRRERRPRGRRTTRAQRGDSGQQVRVCGTSTGWVRFEARVRAARGFPSSSSWLNQNQAG